jgi:hypothetical protein
VLPPRPGWYRGHFSERAGHRHTFEASPYYLAHPAVPQLVAADLPDTRFVALLRVPVERAYSHSQHNVDPERILVLRSEDLCERPAATYARVVDFVGFRPLAETESVSFDVHNHWRSSAPSRLTPELRSRLSEVFEPHNEEQRLILLGTT